MKINNLVKCGEIMSNTEIPHRAMDKCKQWESKADEELANEERFKLYAEIPSVEQIQESAARGLIDCYHAGVMTRCEVDEFMQQYFPGYHIPEYLWNLPVE